MISELKPSPTTAIVESRGPESGIGCKRNAAGRECVVNRRWTPPSRHRRVAAVSNADMAADPPEKSKNLSGARLVIGYVGVAAFLAVALVVSLSLGHGRHAAPAIAGFYKSSNACLGDSFKLAQSGEFVDLSGGVTGKLRLQSGHLTGTVNCASGGTAPVDLAVTGSAATTTLAGTVGS